MISDGQLLLAEEKASLMRRLGRKQMRIELQAPLDALPDSLARYELERGRRRGLTYIYI